ncbi:GNAT family N-acetyltransferase [Hymenobacter cellulosilyticus]|uniref:GNAT family N-acetyltransferase n=1 Tax=Hymenobacter cellulosilyticus TaxID=2932248 RepID=A0A8T9Q0W8_9BACT|nr:GNAT family N-acetyltransferase [Hymenobacter cellulosilyticus]UOQ70522.1 GNAT family N-acetyltransferase [Hymenobacter cellulosilyticus]
MPGWYTPCAAMDSLTTPRLLLRPMQPDDAPGILALDSDPEVLRYLPNQLISTLAEAAATVDYVRQQYEQNGIGRWAVVRQDTGEFVGWCGIKLVNDHVINGRTNYYDIGYRLLQRHWGQGFASEAAQASFRYAFEVLQLPEIHATAMHGNHASRRILERLGMTEQEEFVMDEAAWYWYTAVNSL